MKATEFKTFKSELEKAKDNKNELDLIEHCAYLFLDLTDKQLEKVFTFYNSIGEVSEEKTDNVGNYYNFGVTRAYRYYPNGFNL